MNLLVKILWPEMRPYKWRLVWILVTGALVSALKASLPWLLNHMMTDAWDQKDMHLAIIYSAAIGVTYFISSPLKYLQMYWMLYTSELVAVNLRRRLINKYLTLNLGFLQNFVSGTGGLISRMLNDVYVIQAGFQKIAIMTREPFMILYGFGYLIWVDWRLTILTLIGGPLISMILRGLARSIRKYSQRNLESMEDLTQILKESLDGTRIVQSFNLQNEMRARFEIQAKEYLASKGKVIARQEAAGPVSESLTAFFGIGICIYIGYSVINGFMSNADFVSYVFASGLLADSFRKLQDGYVRLQEGVVALVRFDNILEDSSVVPQIATPKSFPDDWKEIEFKKVTFRYEQNEVLKSIDLKIRRGEKVALVGSSGAGKSTLINLLPRFFDPTEGEIRIGGIPIDEINLADLRSNIALVSQDVFLFSDTVERNIWSGDFSKPRDGVENAARLANAHDFISANPQSYNSRVGDRGSRFSGGEKQRISIARAMFKNAPILILDEATSALDTESELEVQKGLDSLLEGRTALVIAHRLSTISKCDRILVMDKGEIIEQGNHNELMVQKGAYHRFFQIQSRL